MKYLVAPRLLPSSLLILGLSASLAILPSCSDDAALQKVSNNTAGNNANQNNQNNQNNRNNENNRQNERR